MSLEALTLQGLSKFDSGIPCGQFNQLLAECLRDVVDRPHESTARHVELRVLLKPVGQSQGGEVCTVVQVRSKMPALSTADRNLTLRQVRKPGEVRPVMQALFWDDVDEQTAQDDDAKEAG